MPVDIFNFEVKIKILIYKLLSFVYVITRILQYTMQKTWK